MSIEELPEDVASLLALDPGTPVLSMANHYWDQHGQITEYARDYMGPGRVLAAEYDLQ